jgi:DNA-directed RNA polymerase subunit F
MEPKTISQEPISLAELKEEIGKIKQREKESSIRVARIEDYLTSFVEITPEQGKSLRAAITKLAINRLKEEHICKIVDLLPKTVNELKVIMQGYALSLTNDNLAKIVETVNEFLSKAK